MPYINVKVVGPLSREQKEEIAAKFTQTLEDVANKPKDHTYVVFDEIDRQNWAVGDRLLDER
ncbi:MAG: 4-oxalocrotonate tautomerase family protein [Candidatus Omnitrophica bacterium]|nr:4-oxalocrotonate tautomerase family protein [Candidatus Omnitrophota bacterium]